VELAAVIEPPGEVAHAGGTIDSIARYIEEHYSDSFTLTDLARRCGLSPSYFARAFKQTHGVSVFEHLHRTRVKRACLMLKRSDLSVTEIAAALGYNNISFFNRCFRRIIGRTPVEYRRSSGR
jgi:AraC-like DNA-binding protein